LQIYYYINNYWEVMPKLDFGKEELVGDLRILARKVELEYAES